jgi:hypothetical protein
MRHWEKTAKNCDILEVYSSHEVEQLKNIPKIRFERLLPLIMSGGSSENKHTKMEDAFDFGIGGGDTATDMKEILEEQLSGTKAEVFELNQQEEINIDDI